MTEQHDEAGSSGAAVSPGAAQPPGGPQRTDQPGPGLGKVRDTDDARRTDAADPEATEPVGGTEPTGPADDPADDHDQEVQP